MRKIKITALLLAVLMVVTAFAGCASKSTVTNLDNKVGDLEDKIEEQAGALAGIQDSLKDISDKLANDNKQDIIDAVLGELNKDDESGDDIPDDTGATADVATEIGKAGATIEALQGEYAADKVNYTAEDYAAILAIFGDAQATISHCKTVEAVKAALDAMNEKLGKIVAVNDGIYNYIVALTGHIDDDAAELVEEAEAALKEAKKFYNWIDDSAISSALEQNFVAYEIAPKETIDLEVKLQELIDAYDYELPNIKLRARNIENSIKAIKPSDSFAAVTTILATYKVWAKDAKDLSEKNLAFVSNYDALIAAHTSALNASTAKTMYSAETVKSTLFADYGLEKPLFYDYKNVANAVVFTYDTKVSNKPAKALTSEIYKATDAAIAKWAEEYELTAEAVEYIIDSIEGANFYAKYNANKALVAAFEAEYANFEKIADAIKALNNKKLSAEAINVVKAYQKNADDINAWANGLVAAYDAELKADNDLTDRTVDTKAKYEAALKANFNAMIDKADLGVYVPAVVNTTTGLVITPAYYTCELETNEILAKVDTDSANDTLAYYHNLYNFDNAEFANFMRVTFRKAAGEAKAINKKIADLPANQAHAIVALIRDIGGYVKDGTIDGKTALVEISTNEFIATLYGNTTNQATNTLITTPDTIAEFVFAYNTNVAYDLSSLIDTAAYEAKLAKIEANIAAANKVLGAMNDKYAELVGNKGIVLVNMDNYAGIVELYNLLKDFIAAGHKNMTVATEANVTPAGVKEYVLSNIYTPYAYANAAYLDAYTGVIVELRKAAVALKNEADLITEVYNMIGKVAAFGSFGYNEMGGRLDSIKAASAGTASNLKHNGIVSVTIGEPVTADGKATNTTKGTDANPETFTKGERLWTIEYVTFAAQDARLYDVTMKTAKLTCYNAGADANNLPTEVKNLIKEVVWQPSGAAIADYTALANEIFTVIPGLVKASGSIAGLYNALTALAGKAIANYQLPALAMALEAKFEIDNGAAYDAIEAAKKANFDVASGNGFNYVKAMSYAALNAANLAAGNGVIDAAGTAIRDSFQENAVDLDTLTIAVEAVQENLGLAPAKVIFGDADATWMSAEFNIESASCKYNPNAITFAGLEIDLTKRVATGLTVYDPAF